MTASCLARTGSRVATASLAVVTMFAAMFAAMIVGVLPGFDAMRQQAWAGPELGQLAVEPATGTDQMGNIRLITSASCPGEATNFIVHAEGGGFPAQSNAVGSNELTGFSPTASGTGLVVPLHANWEVVAQTNGATEPLDGLVQLTLVCMDPDGHEFGAMSGKVRFTRVPGAPSRFDQVGGPALSSGIPLTPAEALAYSYGVDVAPGAITGSGGITSQQPTGSAAAGSTDNTAPADPLSAAGSGSDAAVLGAGSGSAESGPADRTLLLVGLLVLLAGGGGLLLYRASRASGFGEQ